MELFERACYLLEKSVQAAINKNILLSLEMGNFNILLNTGLEGGEGGEDNDQLDCHHFTNFSIQTLKPCCETETVAVRTCAKS